MDDMFTREFLKYEEAINDYYESLIDRLYLPTCSICGEKIENDGNDIDGECVCDYCAHELDCAIELEEEQNEKRN